MAQAEICPCNLTQQVLVIQLPRGDRGEGDLAAYRDYVVESLAQGVLILGSGTTWAVEALPGLGGVQIQRDPGILRAHSVPEPKADPKPDRPNPWREKKETLERLQQYRQAGGLGCLEAVAGRAVERGIGARGLRAILEEVMTRIMYDVPSDPEVVKVTITEDCLRGGAAPEILRDPEHSQRPPLGQAALRSERGGLPGTNAG